MADQDGDAAPEHEQQPQPHQESGQGGDHWGASQGRD
jgi:hypothetical protein